MGRAYWVCPDCQYMPEENCLMECPLCGSPLVLCDPDEYDLAEGDE